MLYVRCGCTSVKFPNCIFWHSGSGWNNPCDLIKMILNTSDLVVDYLSWSSLAFVVFIQTWQVRRSKDQSRLNCNFHSIIILGVFSFASNCVCFSRNNKRFIIILLNHKDPDCIPSTPSNNYNCIIKLQTEP